jgi:hypothetical protein
MSTKLCFWSFQQRVESGEKKYFVKKKIFEPQKIIFRPFLGLFPGHEIYHSTRNFNTYNTLIYHSARRSLLIGENWEKPFRHGHTDNTPIGYFN